MISAFSKYIAPPFSIAPWATFEFVIVKKLNEANTGVVAVPVILKHCVLPQFKVRVAVGEPITDRGNALGAAILIELVRVMSFIKLICPPTVRASLSAASVLTFMLHAELPLDVAV